MCLMKAELSHAVPRMQATCMKKAMYLHCELFHWRIRLKRISYKIRLSTGELKIDEEYACQQLHFSQATIALHTLAFIVSEGLHASVDNSIGCWHCPNSCIKIGN